MSTAPQHLDAPERSLFSDICASRAISNPAALVMLTAAMEARQRQHHCRELIERDGELVNGRPHQLLIAERMAHRDFLASMLAAGILHP